MPSWVSFIIMILVISFTIFVILAMMLIIVHWRDEIRRKRDEAKVELAKIIVEKSEHQKQIFRLKKQINQLKVKLGEYESTLPPEQQSDEEDE